MTLTTHSLVGAALSTLTGNPVTAFALGVMSHFAIDSLPHGHYQKIPYLRAENEEEFSNRALVVICFDGALGAISAFTLFHGAITPLTTLAGICGGLLPDFLLGIEILYKTQWTHIATKIHNFFHFFFIKKESWQFHPIIAVGTECVVAILAILKSLW